MKEKENLMKKLALGMMPQPEMLAVETKKGKLFIGIPKEISLQEKRIPLTPGDVKVLINNGHEIIVESGAGKGANYDDRDYSEAGARIAYSPEEVYKAHIILKIEPPSIEEIEKMQYNQFLISALQIAIQPKDYLKRLMQKKITAVAFDFITDDEGIFPIIRAMSEIAGTTAIHVAAELLSNINEGQGLMLGGISGIPPAEVVIIGAGTVGEYAARAALGVGASVKLFDNNIYKLRRLQNNIGQRVYTSVIQPSVLRQALTNADVAIGALRTEAGRSPIVVTEEMVKDMKAGAVIIDVSIDQGGCFETSEVTTHEHPTFRKYGVIHYCVPNIASRVARTSSTALSHVLTPILINLGENGGVEEGAKFNYGIRNGIYVYKGILTNRYLGEKFGLPYKDIDLLLAAIE